MIFFLSFSLALVTVPRIIIYSLPFLCFEYLRLEVAPFILFFLVEKHNRWNFFSLLLFTNTNGYPSSNKNSCELRKITFFFGNFCEELSRTAKKCISPDWRLKGIVSWVRWKRLLVTTNGDTPLQPSVKRRTCGARRSPLRRSSMPPFFAVNEVNSTFLRTKLGKWHQTFVCPRIRNKRHRGHSEIGLRGLRFRADAFRRC